MCVKLAAVFLQIKPWQSADFEVIEELTVPRLNLSRVVLNSASGEAMACGVGSLSKNVNTIKWIARIGLVRCLIIWLDQFST